MNYLNPLQCLETQGEDLPSLWICSVTLLHLNTAGLWSETLGLLVACANKQSALK